MAILTISESDRLLRDMGGVTVPVLARRIAAMGYDPTEDDEHTFTAERGGVFRICSDTAIHLNWSGDGQAATANDDIIPAGCSEVFPILGSKVTWTTVGA